MKKTVTAIKGTFAVVDALHPALDNMFESREFEMTPDEIALKLSYDFSFWLLRIPFCIFHGFWQGCVEAWSLARGD